MRPFDRHGSGRHNSTHQTSLTAWLPVLAAMAIMVTGCLSTFLVLQLDEFRPKLGDIVAFKAGSQDTEMWQMTIPAKIVSAAGTPAGACTLDPNVMAEDGGSLVVESVQEAPSLAYTVHWSGTRTAGNNSSCGASAEMTISRTDLQRLANAAGGFGVGDKGVGE
ncbi:MAG: hypothetical protein B7Z80_18030 [Rhodospirillales bacterium 20-64-7]|nr:MAG: hypothetical protein B7Z80_18030 [Rhodospirillales bacterium 20-64-7]